MAFPLTPCNSSALSTLRCTCLIRSSSSSRQSASGASPELPSRTPSRSYQEVMASVWQPRGFPVFSIVAGFNAESSALQCLASSCKQARLAVFQVSRCSGWRNSEGNLFQTESCVFGVFNLFNLRSVFCLLRGIYGSSIHVCIFNLNPKLWILSSVLNCEALKSPRQATK